MTASRAETFRDELFATGLLFPTDVIGVYGRSPVYQDVADRICRAVSTLGAGMASFEMVSFPPILPRTAFAKTNYINSFPDLMGSVHVFRGSDREHAQLVRLLDEGGNWSELLEPAEVVLCSATCHPVYPLCAGRLPAGGRRFEIHGYCFRHEPSVDPTRMQAFHMHELVHVGDADEALAHRDKGLELGLDLLRSLGLPMEAVPANDPFFGRLGAMLAANQMDEALKLEGVTPICSDDAPTAIMSANYHRDHFGVPFGIATAAGTVAHSACVAFGVDRITLALLHAHGLDPGAWPASTRELLWP
jgi:seryl-tRNA synthetase